LGSLDDLRAASLYRSAPVSPIPQPDYLNTAVVGTLGSTSLSPEAVLALAQELERAAGRLPGPRFGPRPLDIDILVYGDRVSGAPELTLPHPRMRERRFVLAPLAEIAPELTVPPDGATVRELLDRLDPESAGGGEVERIAWLAPPF